MRICLLFLLLALPLRAAVLSPAETKALLTALAEQRAKAPALTADFTEEKTTRLLTKPLVTTGTIAFESPNKFRREVTGKSPSLTVSDGQRLWIYYPGFKEAELYTLGQKSFLDDSIAALTAGLNAQRLEKYFTCAASRDSGAIHLQLTPRSSGLKRTLQQVDVWLDGDRRIQRTEATLPQGGRVITRYRNLRFAPLPAGTFEFTPPPGANVTRPLGK